jgi:hypothetical protein
MTEAEWLAATDPYYMLRFLRGKASGRKFRLFAVACCRRSWECPPGGREVDAVAVAERLADGLATNAQRREAEASLGHAGRFAEGSHSALRGNPFWAAMGCAEVTAGASPGEPGVPVHPIVQAALVRDVFGNPPRPVTADPSWLTSTVMQLAQGIYADRAFDRLPILADALQDAGCENGDVLAHCRSEGPHVRGCWVVDLVLGKG